MSGIHVTTNEHIPFTHAFIKYSVSPFCVLGTVLVCELVLRSGTVVIGKTKALIPREFMLEVGVVINQ